MHNGTVTRWKRVDEELQRFQLESRPEKSDLTAELRAVVRCIHEDLFDPQLSVKTLKARCGIRDNNVSLRFRWHLGKTIHEYIEGLRLKAARRLLEQGEVGVFDVALLVGYNHPQTFHRAFERKFACTPGAYRRRFREGGRKNGNR